MASVVLSDGLDRQRAVDARRRVDGKWFFGCCNDRWQTIDDGPAAQCTDGNRP